MTVKTAPAKRLILLDAHAILHRAYHALPDFATSKGQPTGALYGISTMLLKIIEDLKPDYMVACYDLAGPTYRHDVYKAYKAGRKKAEDDLVAQMVSSRDVFKAMGIPIYDKEGFEADDILGTIVKQVYNAGVDIIVASGDMDTLQLVSDDRVKVFTLKKGIKDTIMYNEKAVFDRYGFGPELIPDYKGLRGDPSDNIIGVKGVGEKTATILIQTFGTIENMYKVLDGGAEDRFKKAGISPRIIQLLKDNREEAEFSKMLATIRRDAPITFEFPEKTFREALDVNKVKQLWNELEFRSLGPRLEQVMSGEKSGTASSEPIKTAPKENIPVDELEKVGLALWLIRSDLTNPTYEDVIQFAKTDNFAKAKEVIMTELERRDLKRVYETIELPLIPILLSMEKRGIKIDRSVMKELSETYHKKLNELEKSIWQMAGVEFNINSPKQLGEILFDKLGLTAKNMKKTGGGARSTRESELEKLRDLHPIVPLLFDYRELSKLLGTYIDAIPPLLDSGDRVHTDFISSGSATGRMATQNPGLQNIPIKTELGRAIRKAFIAADGFVLGGFDYSQMELRIAAFLSGDEKLVDIFKKGEDVHTSVAAFVFNVEPSKVTAEMRRQAKVINFGIIYGMGVLALKQNLGSTREAAQKFLNNYFETFSTLAKYLDRIKAETARRGYTETFFGRRRYFEGINSKIPYIKAAAERMAINAPVQGTGADVIKLALIRIDEYIKREKLENDVFALLQVHDELIYEIRKDKAEKVARDITAIMESVMDPKDTRGVKLAANAKLGGNWGELK